MDSTDEAAGRAERAQQREDAVAARQRAIEDTRATIAESKRLLEAIRQQHATTGTEATDTGPTGTETTGTGDTTSTP